MGGKTQDTDNEDVKREESTESNLEAAFEAGFNSDPEFKISDTPVTNDKNGDDLPNKKDVTPPAEDAPADDVPAEDAPADDVPADDVPADDVPADDVPADDVPADKPDPWEGIPDAIKNKFNDMSKELERVTNIANSASGRANKLQSQLQQNQDKSKAKAKPTSQQIHEAMVDKDKRDALREEWPDFADAFDELDSTISSVVGSQIDSLRAEMQSGQQKYIQEQIKYNLDTKHPDWQNTVQGDSFKSWVYDGGPDLAERGEYEKTLSYAQSLMNNSPSEAKTLFAQANTLYSNMLDKYPKWAEDRGTLYGDPSGDAAIRLLDLHKAAQDEKAQDDMNKSNNNKSKQKRNSQRLADNVSPTTGSSKQKIVDAELDLNAAFEAGFNS